jgi:hypothetical protein
MEDALSLGRQRALELERYLEPAIQGGKRGAQFMADHRDEIGFGLVQLAQAQIGLLELACALGHLALEVAVERGDVAVRPVQRVDQPLHVRQRRIDRKRTGYAKNKDFQQPLRIDGQ